MLELIGSLIWLIVFLVLVGIAFMIALLILYGIVSFISAFLI